MFRSSFRVPTVRFSKNGDENLTGVTRKPDKKQRLKMVLNTRDIEDSGTIFGFPVSIHKKSAGLLKKFRPKSVQFGDLDI